MLRSLVGSEMCIRDSLKIANIPENLPRSAATKLVSAPHPHLGSLCPRPQPESQARDDAILPERPPHIDRGSMLRIGTLEAQSCSVCEGGAICLLYTSDAADEEDSVDLGGRRIIKKKKNKEESTSRWDMQQR
eukprot:TRINITY_DN42617_c0_g1_i1.p1 TRINITY_DN42617_c0_g1~~TRINITY_DN42617_c0_g1_i1.p1  ORF type:complete len:133 (-),score=26.59 TRINITY_DN42617_c0_g1_i1:47-445(-)